MKYYKSILFLSLLITTTVFSQEKWIKHTVKKGETIATIAQKYKVDPTAIYQLNPDCSRVLKLQSIIVVPSQGSKTIKTILAEHSHQVQPKETLFGIAKQYEITLEELNNANPELAKTGLQTGQKISIPTKASSKNELLIAKQEPKTSPNKTVVLEEKRSLIVAPEPNKTATHEVLPLETKFGIAKQYGISVADLETANPILEKEGLKSGQKINIPIKETTVVAVPVVKEAAVVLSKKQEVKEKIQEKTPEKEVALDKEITTQQNLATVIHEVLPKETKFGIAKKYGILVTELESQNPAIVKNLYVGARLTISGTKAIQDKVPAPETQNETVANAELAQKQDNITIASSIAKWNTNEELADELIRMASDNLGSRYRSGGTSKNGFDCSGLIYSTFGSLDIKLPRSSYEMSSTGIKVEASEAKKGDLIFFKTNGRNQINHVGMVVEVLDGEIRFIHSSTQNGVIISSTKERYYEKKFSQINRVIQQ